MSKTIVYLFLVLFGLISCQNTTILPKPKSQLRLAYPQAKYNLYQGPCPFSFEVSNLSSVVVNKKCWVTIKYPILKASIDITYKPVNNNLKQLLQDAEKLTYSHAIKADGIDNQPYINNAHKVYATVYHVSGNAASPLQFHATDSTKHFLTGAIYFNAVPNYDSVYPAIKYIEADLKHLIETINWN